MRLSVLRLSQECQRVCCFSQSQDIVSHEPGLSSFTIAPRRCELALPVAPRAEAKILLAPYRE